MSITRTISTLRFIFGFIALTLILSSCCDCDKTKPGASDSTRTSKDTIPGAQQFSGAIFKKFTVAASVPPRRIPNDDAVLGSRFNVEFPCLRQDGKFVNGFMFDPTDFTEVTGLKPASLFFQIAVTNAADSVGLRNHSVAPSYTIVVIPVDEHNNQLRDPKTQEPLAFDFTCPCPANTACCPKQ